MSATLQAFRSSVIGHQSPLVSFLNLESRFSGRSMKYTLLSRASLAVGLLSSIPFLSGCGNANEFKVSAVSGTVTCNGKPLTEGLVIFEPIPDAGRKAQESGRSATGIVQPDGTFILSTYRKNDGAMVGKHIVKVFAPAPEDDDAPITEANRYACGNTPIEKEILVGKNIIELELRVATKSKVASQKR